MIEAIAAANETAEATFSRLGLDPGSGRCQISYNGVFDRNALPRCCGQLEGSGWMQKLPRKLNATEEACAVDEGLARWSGINPDRIVMIT